MEQQQHSALGIASFIIGIFSIILSFVIFIVAGVMEASTPGGIDETSSAAIVVGLLVIGTLFIEVVAVCLGVIALFQKNRKKIFAILGVVFSGGMILITISLIVIGNTMARGLENLLAASQSSVSQSNASLSRLRSPNRLTAAKRRYPFVSRHRTVKRIRLQRD